MNISNQNILPNSSISCSIYSKFSRGNINALQTPSNSGASPGLGRGGPRNFYFQIWKFACRKATCCAWQSHACALLGGFGGMPPRENFLKWCNLVRFDVYFDHILSLKNFKNYHFLYKKFKNCNFLYKRINNLDTRLL